MKCMTYSVESQISQSLLSTYSNRIVLIRERDVLCSCYDACMKENCNLTSALGKLGHYHYYKSLMFYNNNEKSQSKSIFIPM